VAAAKIFGVEAVTGSSALSPHLLCFVPVTRAALVEVDFLPINMP